MANLKVVDADVLDANLTSVADSIRAKTGSADTLVFPDGFVSAVESVESADSALEEIEYAMTKDDTGESYKQYDYLFYRKQFMTEAPMIFQHISSGTSFRSMFQLCEKLIELPILDTSNGTNFRNMFDGCNRLTTIESINISNAEDVYEMFRVCNVLANITFNGVIKITGLYLAYCPLLTHDSLMSAINALYDHASAGTSGTYTLTLGSTNKAKLTEDELYIATSKGWTVS